MSDFEEFDKGGEPVEPMPDRITAGLEFLDIGHGDISEQYWWTTDKTDLGRRYVIEEIVVALLGDIQELAQEEADHCSETGSNTCMKILSRIDEFEELGR